MEVLVYVSVTGPKLSFIAWHVNFTSSLALLSENFAQSATAFGRGRFYTVSSEVPAILFHIANDRIVMKF